MKFSGELKFPEIDHPGVPVNFIIEESQAELSVGGESLGRWSLYDVHARRLVASAFQIDLDGTEVTFVADDPIDFAYRGVEHMAETWAKIKSKGIATRSLAVRKSRKGTSPSRIEDMKSAMVSNLETVSEPRQIAGEVAMPEETAATESTALAEDVAAPDTGDEAAIAAPAVDSEALVKEREQLAREREKLAEERERLEEERQKLTDDRARFDEERRLAEQREADRIEAYRLEMKRLEAEREALSQRAQEMSAEDVIETPTAGADFVVGDEVEPAFTEPEPDEEEATSEEVSEPEEPQLEGEPVEEPQLEEEPDEELEPDEEPESGLVDLNDLEEEPGPPPPAEPEPVAPGPDGHKEPEPAMAGATRDRGGLMGAVRAAFRSGSRDHEHQFIEAPGGIGITRYVCEECGYVSISV